MFERYVPYGTNATHPRTFRAHATRASHLGTFDPVLHVTSRLCIVGVMPTGTDPQPGDFSEALMQVIRARMAYLNFNITELSEKTGIPRATLSRIVNNKRVAHLENLREIALAIEMPMAQLFTAAERNLEGKDPFANGNGV